MSFDNVSNYTLNRYQGQCNPSCTCRQQSTTYTAMPALFDFGMPMTIGFGCQPFNFMGGTLVNPFLFQIFNPFQLLNNLNINFSLPQPAINSPAADFSASMPLGTSMTFGSLTLPAPVVSSVIKDTTPPPGSKKSTSSISAFSNQKATLLKTVEKNDDSFADQLKEKGVVYNAELGHNLAKYTINHTTGGTGRCAHYVNNALEEYNINAKRDNHAYTRAEVLANDSNFTEITVSNKEDLKKLPGGSVVVYDQGACNYSSEHGHVFIATGNGGAASDHLQNSIKYGDGVRVFIPTKQTEATV